MTYLNFEGHRVFYERKGSGEPIVFLPNATLDGKLWEFQADHLKTTYDVIVVDLPGLGRSERVTPSLDLWVRWLGRFLDELGLAPTTLVGNCMGSLTALHYAVANPDKVSALVLIHTLDNDVGRAGPMGGGGRLVDHMWFRPAVEWMVRHQPAWTWQKHPGPFDKMATVYPSSQFGDVADDRQSEYTAHAFERFAEVDTRLNLVRLAYASETCTLPSAELLAQAPPICWIWAEANKLLPHEVGRRQLDVLHPEEVHVTPSRGYAVAWEAPEVVNPIIETFLTRHVAQPKTHPKAS